MKAAQISKRNVEGMGGRVMRSAVSAGVDVTNWALIEGSSTYGRQYRLVKIDRLTGGERDLHLLGMTRAEAYRSLHSMAVAFELVTLKWACEGCNALPGEPCSPFCTAHPSAQS